MPELVFATALATASTAELLAQAPTWLRTTLEWLWEEHKRDLLFALWAGFWGITRLAGKTVSSGEVGVKFSFGRAVRVCEPGFYPLVPIFQTIRTVPSRARTLDLPRQRLTTRNGYVFEVDATLVYRVVDPRQALIQIDSLERGMLQMLGVSVYEVLAELDGAELRVSQELDGRLAQVMGARLERWGVQVERAGFATLHPSRETVRITQLGRRVATRSRAAQRFVTRADGGAALGLLGMGQRIVSRTRAQRVRELRTRRRRWLPLFLERFDHFAKSNDALAKTSVRERARVLARERFERVLVR